MVGDTTVRGSSPRPFGWTREQRRSRPLSWSKDKTGIDLTEERGLPENLKRLTNYLWEETIEGRYITEPCLKQKDGPVSAYVVGWNLL